MKRTLFILLVILECVLFTGCNNYNSSNLETQEPEIYIISGNIVSQSHCYYTTNIIIETEDGYKIPVYERYSSFSNGLQEGDKVSFEVEKIYDAYKIIGIAIDNINQTNNE